MYVHAFLSVSGACEDAALSEPPEFPADSYETLATQVCVHRRTDLQAVWYEHHLSPVDPGWNFIYRMGVDTDCVLIA